jgi:1,4-dihydroxy-2-naphthoyl-CoA hydrolase
VPDLDSMQRLLAPLLPGLLGVSLTDASPDRVVATMVVRREICTTGDALHGGAIMAFADTLGAVGTFVINA